MNLKYNLLKESLVSPPGWKAQKIMAPSYNDKYRSLTHNYKSAGVMALLYKEKGEDYIIIIERSRSNPNDKHAGQLSFPGGKYEDSDLDILSCAIREVEEEIGITKDYIHVLGPLTQLFVFTSNFLVFPYVGYLNVEPIFSIQESEVHAVHTVPVSHLLTPDTKKTKDIISDSGITLHNVPYYDLEGKELWGATAMILSELEIIISQTIGL